MRRHKQSQGQVWPQLSAVAPKARSAPPQPVTSGRSPSPSPPGKGQFHVPILPLGRPLCRKPQQFPGFSILQHLESGRVGTSSAFYLVVQIPGLGPPRPPTEPKWGSVATAPAVGKEGRDPSAPQQRLSPLPRQLPAAPRPQFSLPPPHDPPSPHAAPSSPGDKGPRDRPPTGSRHSRRGCERAEGRGHMTGTPAPLAVASPHSSLPRLRHFLRAPLRPALPEGARSASRQVRGAARARWAGVGPFPSPRGTRGFWAEGLTLRGCGRLGAGPAPYPPVARLRSAQRAR